MSNMARAGRTRRLKRIQTTSLIFIICVVNYMDRGTLSVANPLIRNELGLSVAEMGILLSAFLWPYAITLLLAGAIVDRGKPRRVLVISLIVWSVAQAMAGFVTSYVQFVIARALLGVG
ncbi:MAG TPA: MFS transporter, partial [Rhodopila sp.]|nr:MFS transporter [Rhodopila sp.]